MFTIKRWWFTVAERLAAEPPYIWAITFVFEPKGGHRPYLRERPRA